MTDLTRRTALLLVLTGSLTVGRAASAAESSVVSTALQQAKERGQHVFVLFYRRDDAATRAMRSTLERGVNEHSAAARMVAVNVQDPAERKWVEQWKLSRAPMPLTIAMAPNGAVTGGFPLKITAEQMDQAIVSRATAACLLAGQAKKMVLLCVHSEEDQPIPAGVQAFVQDPGYGPATEVVAIQADDPSEAQLLQALKLAPNGSTQVGLIVPPGSLLASYPETVTKDQLISTLKSARSSCCPGGQCGPGGPVRTGGLLPGGQCGPGANSAQRSGQ